MGRVRACVILLAFVAVDSGLASAQTSDNQRGLRRDPAERLRFIEPASPSVEVQLPALAEPATGSSAAADFPCSQAILEGNTALPAAAADAVLAPLAGRRLTFEDVLAARLALTRLYLDAGYITSGVIVPDQDLGNGVLRFLAIEGKLDAVRLTGRAPRLDVARLLRPIESLRGRALNLIDLRRELAFLDSDPRVSRIHARLAPGNRPGESILFVDIEARRGHELSLAVDNYRAPSLGGEQFRAAWRHWSLFGRSDELFIESSTAEGSDDLYAAYVLPLGRSLWSLELAYADGDSAVIEEPFDRIDIESRSDRRFVGLVRQLRSSARRSAQLAVGFDSRDSLTTLLGVPFSFAPGVVDGRAATDAVRIRYDLARRQEDSALAVRAVLSVGVDDGVSNPVPGQPDSRFASLYAQAQYVRALGPRGQVHADVQLQLSNDALLPLEKFSLGGVGTVRGFRQNQLVRDNGFSLGLEYRQDTGWTPGLRWSVFVDAGRGWNSGSFSPAPQGLASLGVGLLWDPDEAWSGRLDLAHGFSDFQQGERDLQDRGIHFSLAYRWR